MFKKKSILCVLLAIMFIIATSCANHSGQDRIVKTKDEWITEVANAEIEKNIYFGFTKTAYPISSSIVQKTDDVYAFIQIRSINEYTTIALCCVYLKVVVPDNLSDSKKIKQSQILIQPIDTKIKVFYS